MSQLLSVDVVRQLSQKLRDWPRLVAKSLEGVSPSVNTLRIWLIDQRRHSSQRLTYQRV